MRLSYRGIAEADIVDTRFAFSGKVSSVGKHDGETVKQWEWIASLDKKILQTELDLELADYEKARAEFEIFNLKNGQSGDDITKFLRAEKQASLNAAVKQVELAKYKMDQAELVSPVAGIILDMGGLTAEIHITPASASVKIQDMSSLKIRFEIPQKDIPMFEKETTGRVVFPEQKKEYRGKITSPGFGTDGIFLCFLVLDDPSGLLPGMVGKVTPVS